MSPDDARKATLDAFGDRASIEAEVGRLRDATIRDCDRRDWLANSEWRANVMGVLRGGARSTRRAESRLRSGLVVAQLSLAVVLLVGARLLMRSFLMQSADAEYRTPARVRICELCCLTRHCTCRRASRAAGERQCVGRRRPSPLGPELNAREQNQANRCQRQGVHRVQSQRAAAR